MKLRRILARHGTSLRAMLAVLALTLTLNGIAYVTHHHEAIRGATTHAELCGYCSAFGGLAAAPSDLLKFRSLAPMVPVMLLFAVLLPRRRPLTAAQPRAPPAR
jgi:hypothetical protein